MDESHGIDNFSSEEKTNGVKEEDDEKNKKSNKRYSEAKKGDGETRMNKEKEVLAQHDREIMRKEEARLNHEKAFTRKRDEEYNRRLAKKSFDDKTISIVKALLNQGDINYHMILSMVSAKVNLNQFMNYPTVQDLINYIID